MRYRKLIFEECIWNLLCDCAYKISMLFVLFGLRNMCLCIWKTDVNLFLLQYNNVRMYFKIFANRSYCKTFFMRFYIKSFVIHASFSKHLKNIWELVDKQTVVINTFLHTWNTLKRIVFVLSFAYIGYKYIYNKMQFTHEKEEMQKNIFQII